MGGEASIYSELGRGTIVRLHLPVADAEVTETRVAPASAPAPTPQGRRVLLVEDEELLRQALDRTLSEAGFAVMTAESAEKALGRLDSDELPDLLVSDVSLPGDGRPRACAAAARAGSGPAGAADERVRRAPAAPGLVGRAAMIDKPFPTRELLAQIAALPRRRRRARTPEMITVP